MALAVSCKFTSNFPHHISREETTDIETRAALPHTPVICCLFYSLVSSVLQISMALFPILNYISVL